MWFSEEEFQESTLLGAHVHAARCTYHTKDQHKWTTMDRMKKHNGDAEHTHQLLSAIYNKIKHTYNDCTGEFKLNIQIDASERKWSNL